MSSYQQSSDFAADLDGFQGVDGYEATRRIRQSSNLTLRKVKIVSPGLSVSLALWLTTLDVCQIALTASAIKGDRERCIEAGFDRYLAKVRCFTFRVPYRH